MSRSFQTLRAVLLQGRVHRDIAAQELDCFLERTRLRTEQITTRNVVYENPVAHWLEGMDAFFIGGAGEYSAWDDYPWMPALLELIENAYEDCMPTFGSCWGHQLIARALGGKVVYDGELAELGCFRVELTEAGVEDPLFQGFPSSFFANMGHHDRVTQLPPGAVHLARSESQPNQAFRMKGRPIYGTQFHSELDARRERERLIVYRKHYPEIETEAEFQTVLGNLRETTEVDDLLHQFLLRCVMDEHA